MPMYEYKCQGCGEVFEVIQRFTDAPLQQHESCGGAVERLLSAPALQFKGSGWYITDYARNSGGTKAKNGDAGSKSDTPSAPKSDSTSTTSSTSSDAKK